MKKKSLILAIFIVVLIVLGGFFIYRSDSRNKETVAPSTAAASAAPSEKDSPAIVSTKPDPLDKTILPSTQEIEITFNRSLENVGEFKVKIEPKIDFKLELSQDRKTGRIKPAKPYELGTTYTIFIGPDSKFDGVGEWGQTKTFQFNTIKYSGV